MKRLFLLAICVVFAAGAVNAQEISKKGDFVLNGGVGLGSNFGGGLPIAISGDYGIVDGLIGGDNGSITVGGYVGYVGYTSWDWKYTNIIIGARGAFHYQFLDKLDTYAGLMLGYNVASVKWVGAGSYIDNVSAGGGFTWSTFIGARYFFTPKLGVFAELGYGIAYATLGVTYKF